MNFQDLKKIEDYDFYLDVAFRRAKKKVEEKRQTIKEKDRLKKAKKLEEIRIEVIKSNLEEDLGRILKNFPSIDSMDDFYKELIRCTLDYDDLKKSLGSVNWAIDKINFFFRTYRSKMQKAIDIKNLSIHRKEYYGRISSILKQIKPYLYYLEEARKTMRDYPAIKTSIYTVCLFGFPNVGKSTLLSRLTSATPEIKAYAFTTKNLNLGYINLPAKKIQIIDTPGTLNRLDKMNSIELQAYLALKHLADHVVFVIDPTDPEQEKHKKLLLEVKKFKKPITIYLSKTDIADSEIVKSLISRYTDVITDTEKIKEKIIQSSSL